MKDGGFYIEDRFDGSIEKISDLFRTDPNSSESICSPVYLDWLYDQNPHGKAVISSARENGSNKLVGVYIVNPVTLWLNGEVKRSALSLNTFTHEDFRGKGIFTKLAKTCYDQCKVNGISSVIGFPNKYSYGGFLKKLSFVDLGTVNHMAKPLSYFSIAKDILFSTTTNSQFDKCQNLPESIYQIDQSNIHDLDSFFEEHRKKVGLQTFRSSQHYFWRFISHPLRTYKLLAARDAEQNIASVIVLGLSRGRTNDLVILDFCTLDETVGKKLLQYVIKHFKSKFSLIRIYAQPKTLENKICSNLGFQPKARFTRTKTFLPFIYRNLESEDPVLDFDSWHLTMSDTDVI